MALRKTDRESVGHEGMKGFDELKTLLDQAPYGMGLFREGGGDRAVYLNDTYYSMMDYTRAEYASLSAAELSGLLRPEDAAAATAAEELRRRGVCEGEYRAVPKSGRTLYVELRAHRIKAGGECAVLCVFTDVTRQRETEEALRRERARYRLALEQARSTVLEWDLRTGEFYCSESYHRYALSRTDPREVLRDRAPSDCVCREDLPTLRKFFAAGRGAATHRECVLRLRMMDGSFRWCRVSGQRTLDGDGKPLWAMGVITDVNDDMEKSLMMDGLVGMLPGGVAVLKFTPELKCLYYNQAVLRLGIFTEAELQLEQMTRQHTLSLIFPADRELFREEVLDKAARGEGINCNFRFDHAARFEGREINWVHLSAVKIREEDGCPVYYAIFSEPSEQIKIFKQISERSLVAELALEAPSGNILYANRAFGTLTGLESGGSALIGRDCAQVLDAADAAVLKGMLHGGRDGETEETTIWTSGGKYLRIQAHFLNWNGKKAFLFYFSDQTETKLLADRQSKIINNVPGGIGIYEIRDGKVIQRYLNDAFHRMLHDTRSNRGKYSGDRFLDAIHPDDLPAFREMMESFLRGGKSAAITYRVLDGFGNWVWFRLSAQLDEEDKSGKIIYCSFFDVDEQTRMQLVLKREQTLLRQAMQAAKMSSWEYDVKKKTLVETETSQDQHGYGKRLEDVPESLIRDGLIHPDSVEEYRWLFRPAADENDVRHADVLVKTADGHSYWWERIFVTPVFDGAEGHVRSVGTSIDVTEQKNAESTYRRRMQELSSADSADLIAKGLYNLTKNRNESYDALTENAVTQERVLSYDDGLSSTSGTFFEAGAARRFLELFGRRQLLQSFARGDMEVSMEYQRKARDGTIFWARTQCRLAADPRGDDVYCFIYSRDINEQRLAQETIRAVIGMDYDFFAVLDCRSNSYVLYSGQGDERGPLPPLRSLDYEGAVRAYVMEYVEKADAERNVQEMSIQNIRAQLRRNKSFVSYVNLAAPEGETIRKKMRFSYLDRQNEQVLITRMDITDIYEQEQRRLTELRTAARALQQANSVKTDFLARMSHDLRTPMNAVIGLTELATDERSDPAAMEYYLTSIRAAGKFLLGLVNDCLDFEKLSANQLRLHPTPYTYSAFRQSIFTMIEPLCREKQQEFFFAPGSNEYTVQMDAVRLEQIFINLLTNAVKFTPAGGRVEFLIRNRVVGGGVLSVDFVVRDNGIGMSREFQQRMFEPFEQENGSGLSQAQGTGLGLAIVKNLVELMGGTIAVQSEPGRGTEFSVHLDMPLVVDAAAPLPDQPGPEDFSQLAGSRVLLVEDHPMNTEIARRLLEKKGVSVTCVVNGAQAVELFAASPLHSWDAVLMDVRMPVMDGLQAARAIRALPREDAGTVPIIAMTANAFEEDVRATREAGMNAHLAKPIEPAGLYGTLRQFLTGNRKDI